MTSNNWTDITKVEDIHSIVEASHEQPQLIYKHSTRCNLSATIKYSLEKWDKTNQVLPIHYLDLISYRSVSDFIEQHFGIMHESPQIIIIHQGKVIYDEDHFRINGEDIEKALQASLA